MGHPSGPNLPGHPVCGPGRIFDHVQQRCVSVTAYAKEHGVEGHRALGMALKTLGQKDAAA